jgi:hypothetical protein
MSDEIKGTSKAGRGRGRGAQPGNLNRIEHGMYSRRKGRAGALPAGSQALDAAALDEEIEMLRVYIRRVFELGSEEERDVDLAVSVHVLGSLGMASTRLAKLLAYQRVLGSEQDEVSAALFKALRELSAELRPGAAAGP